MKAWNSDPAVLTCAITGADVFRENNPNILDQGSGGGTP